jgi:LruC domain-containing protein
MRKIIYIKLLLLTVLFSCKRDYDIYEAENGNKIINEDVKFTEMVISENFNFKATSEIRLNISAKDNTDQPIPGVRLDIYTDEIENGGYLMFSGMTNENGVMQMERTFPSYLETILVKANFIGLPSSTEIELNSNYIDVTLGGAIDNIRRSSSRASTPAGYTLGNHFINFMGSYNSQGTPGYLESQNDQISSSFLKDLNNALPESSRVPQRNPEYLATANQTEVAILQDAEVWVTFVHEGAGYKNTLGYYVYDINNPPTSASQIDTVNIIFPNVSYLNSGGGLVSGNKVKLGRFDEGQAIGWVLFANGYNNNRVQNPYWTFYSNPKFNPESSTSLKQHNVMLNDPGRDLVLLTFEDIKRDQSGCDQDFNDAIFYVTANPITAIDVDEIPVISYTGNDKDNDGVSDEMDDYPTDPTKAFNNYYPGKGVYGTLAFEDLWPGNGDYDFNDLVVDYNINQITNASNKVVEIEAEYVVNAIGASYKNGFGFQMDIAPSLIKSVTGQQFSENNLSISSNGTESGQNKAVVMVFDNAYKLFPVQNHSYINTLPEYTKATPQKINLKIELSSPQSVNNLGIPPYNPFIFVNQKRNHEVHLPDMEPTSKADRSLFGQYADYSNPSTGRYYKSKDNFPWAIHVPEKIAHPVEYKDITTAYLKFAAWAQSNGNLYKDWYKDLSGYRRTANIYTK